MSAVALGTAAVGAIGSYAASSKLKSPAAVQYQPVDVGAVAGSAVDANIANSGKIQQLTASTNTFQQDQATSLMEKALPGWSKLQSSLMKTTQDLLTNPYDTPPDVQANLERISAEKGISAGTRGQFNDFSLLRDLGVNELQYGSSRISQAGTLTSLLASTAPKVNPMSPLSMFVTPDVAVSQAQHGADQTQAIGQGAANSVAALNNYRIQTLSNGVASVAGAVAGIDWSGGGSAGVGAKTSYNDFIKNNPTSQAATGP
jgi:hypothetical protein